MLFLDMNLGARILRRSHIVTLSVLSRSTHTHFTHSHLSKFAEAFRMPNSSSKDIHSNKPANKYMAPERMMGESVLLGASLHSTTRSLIASHPQLAHTSSNTTPSKKGKGKAVSRLARYDILVTHKFPYKAASSNDQETTIENMAVVFAVQDDLSNASYLTDSSSSLLSVLDASRQSYKLEEHRRAMSIHSTPGAGSSSSSSDRELSIPLRTFGDYIMSHEAISSPEVSLLAVISHIRGGLTQQFS